jgi:ABC-2 type transport system permease protein
VNLRRGLVPLTIANIKTFYRDRASLFWTIAFPVVFVVLFGSIFSSSGPSTIDIGWVDQDQTPASAQLRAGFAGVDLLSLRDESLDDALADMRTGDLDSVIVVPAGLARAMAASSAGTPKAEPFNLTVYTDPSQTTSTSAVQQIVGQVVGGINQSLTGQPPTLGVATQAVQAQNLTNAAYFVPSILAMALMQLGIFAAIPLTAQREKLILKRLGATPLSRGTLVLSNVLTRMLIAIGQTVIIIAIGAALFGVQIVGNPVFVAALVILGAVTFLSIGYLIASFARTEDTANTLASVVQFPLMFLSGIFFPIEFMPEWLRPVAAFLPLTYLGDALRQTMVGGTAYAPLPMDVLVLGGWLIVTFLIAARYFRWQ